MGGGGGSYVCNWLSRLRKAPLNGSEWCREIVVEHPQSFRCRLVEELKEQNPDFPDISGGIYVHGVVPLSPADKYASTRFVLLHV